MVVEYIRYSIDSERAQVFEQAYRRAAVALDASEHCVRYEVAAARILRSTSFASIGTQKRDTCPGFAAAPSSAASSGLSARSYTTSMRCAITRSRSQATDDNQRGRRSSGGGTADPSLSGRREAF
jgi:hypothetical protein